MPGLMNWELAEQLAAVFQKRYEPNFAWGNAVSAFSLLPGLRGFWPMSTAMETGNAIDLSGQARTLSYNGNPTYRLYTLAPFIAMDGVGDYLSRADEAGLRILGTETTITSTLRGLTFGGWFLPTVLPGADMALISKFTTAGNQRAYIIYINNTNNPACIISGTGADAFTATHTSAVVAATGWYFIWGRFRPSTAVDIGINTNYVSQAAGIPAAIFNSNAGLLIGSSSAGAALYNGWASNCFLCAAALPDYAVNQLYEQSRAMYGA